MATPLTNSVGRTGIHHLDGLLQGSKWSSTNLTYSLWTDEYSWTGYGKQLFAAALQTIESYTNLRFSFIETNGAPHLSTDLEAMLTGSTLRYLYGNIGMGIFPDTRYGDQLLRDMGLTRNQWGSPEGAIFYDNEAYPYLVGLQPSGEGWTVILHEILHALGLKHPHDNGGNDRPTYQQLGLNWADDQLFTIMSYNTVFGSTTSNGNPITPMVFDVAALQHLYGANMSTFAGHDVHWFKEDGMISTLWDAGGVDWVNATSSKTAAVINLASGMLNYSQDSFFITALGTTLEHAIGSYHNDRIEGNAVGNIIHGHSGSDTIRGGAGSDTLHGGYTIVDPRDANDTIYGDEGADFIYGNGGNDLIYGGSGVEEIAGDERDEIYGGFGVDTIYGGAGLDYIAGGGGQVDPGDLGDWLDGGSGFDYILGNGGNDTIIGGTGDDGMHGGVGDDVYRFSQGHGRDVIMHFEGAGVAGGDVLAYVRHGTYTTAQSLLNVMTMENGSVIFDFGNGDRIAILSPGGLLTAGDIWMI